MKSILAVLAVFCWGAAALAAPPERYLHLKVDELHHGRVVSVNIPLSLAEKVLPAINNGQLRDGKVSFGNIRANGVDLKAILEAVRTAPDGEFVVVKEPVQKVRVAKSNGELIVHVLQSTGDEQNVEVTIPWAVAEALASSGDRELDIEAAIRALEKAGDTTLMIASDHGQSVRIWVDSRNTSE